MAGHAPLNRVPDRRRAPRRREADSYPKRLAGVTYGRDYTGKPINGDKTAQAGMEQPVYFWTPDIAPSGIGFYTGKMFPAWDGDLFVAGLAAKYLVRLVLKDERVIAEEHLLTDLDMRGVASGTEQVVQLRYGPQEAPAGSGTAPATPHPS